MAPPRHSKKNMRPFDFRSENAAAPHGIDVKTTAAEKTHPPPNTTTAPLDTSAFPALPTYASVAKMTNNHPRPKKTLSATPAWRKPLNGSAVSAPLVPAPVARNVQQRRSRSPEMPSQANIRQSAPASRIPSFRARSPAPPRQPQQSSRGFGTGRCYSSSSSNSSNNKSTLSNALLPHVGLRSRPKWKIPTASDIEPNKFVWIEPLQPQQQQQHQRTRTNLTTTTTTTNDHNDPNEGWRGHPALILGAWDGHVHLLGTTSWGGAGPSTKFHAAADPAAFTRWFVRVVGERDALEPGERETAVVRLRGDAAFSPQTRLDCRSVRRVPVARFAAECSRYFRKRRSDGGGDGGPRREVWVREEAVAGLTARLFRLGGLAASPWKAVDFGLLREWKAHMVETGYRLDDEEEEEEDGFEEGSEEGEIREVGGHDELATTEGLLPTPPPPPAYPPPPTPPFPPPPSYLSFLGPLQQGSWSGTLSHEKK